MTYRNKEAKDGSLSVKIFPPLSSTIRLYCKEKNISTSDFLIAAAEEKLKEGELNGCLEDR